jgi:uracil-DNA glycosylase
VFGIGYTRVIMFVGDGPNEEAEVTGVPFVGSSGGVLRTLLARLGLKEYYLTNLVTCRSCEPMTNSSGELIQRRQGSVMMTAYKDEPPIPAHVAACRPRLNEEIYIVDPTVIVGLGAKACEALVGRSVNLAKDNGEARPITIPGATYVPERTDVGQHWLRKVRGNIVQPIRQSEVRYHFVPTFHPRDVEKVMDDAGNGNVFGRFTRALREAIQTHDAYVAAAYGVEPINRGQVSDLDLQHAVQETQHEEA